MGVVIEYSYCALVTSLFAISSLIFLFFRFFRRMDGGAAAVRRGGATRGASVHRPSVPKKQKYAMRVSLCIDSLAYYL